MENVMRFFLVAVIALFLIATVGSVIVNPTVVCLVDGIKVYTKNDQDCARLAEKAGKECFATSTSKTVYDCTMDRITASNWQEQTKHE